jgi:hypothetical protein
MNILIYPKLYHLFTTEEVPLLTDLPLNINPDKINLCWLNVVLAPA